MARHSVRVDFRAEVGDFLKLSLEPGTPMLDPGGANYRTLAGWLGQDAVALPLVAPDGESVAFHLARDGARRLDLEVRPVDVGDLDGPFAPTIARMDREIRSANWTNDGERALLKRLLEAWEFFQAHEGRDARLAHWFKYEDAAGQWQPLFCWGYAIRPEVNGLPIKLCDNPRCATLFVHRGAVAQATPRCPHCRGRSITSIPSTGPATRRAGVAGSGWRLPVGRALVVALAALAVIALLALAFRSGRPDEEKRGPGGEIVLVNPVDPQAPASTGPAPGRTPGADPSRKPGAPGPVGASPPPPSERTGTPSSGADPGGRPSGAGGPGVAAASRPPGVAREDPIPKTSPGARFEGNSSPPPPDSGTGAIDPTGAPGLGPKTPSSVPDNPTRNEAPPAVTGTVAAGEAGPRKPGAPEGNPPRTGAPSATGSDSAKPSTPPAAPGTGRRGGGSSGVGSAPPEDPTRPDPLPASPAGPRRDEQPKATDPRKDAQRPGDANRPVAPRLPGGGSASPEASTDPGPSKGPSSPAPDPGPEPPKTPGRTASGGPKVRPARPTVPVPGSLADPYPAPGVGPVDFEPRVDVESVTSGPDGKVTIRFRVSDPIPPGPIRCEVATDDTPGVESVEAEATRNGASGLYEARIDRPKGGAAARLTLKVKVPGEKPFETTVVPKTKK